LNQKISPVNVSIRDIRNLISALTRHLNMLHQSQKITNCQAKIQTIQAKILLTHRSKTTTYHAIKTTTFPSKQNYNLPIQATTT